MINLSGARRYVPRVRALGVALLIAALPLVWYRALQPRPARPTTPVTTVGYEHANWRLLPLQELNKVALWVSHIVIAHRDSNAAATSLRPPGWAPDGPWPNRSEAEALVLALKVAAEASRAPEDFDRLARKYSDDVVTRDVGGALGGIRGGQIPSEFLDALAVLKPGQVSHVIKTPFGYHILKRRPSPPPERVAGNRIVIRYLGTYGGVSTSKITRTRAEAKVLAEEIAKIARDHDRPFDELVARYSDNADKVEGGDLGVWSLRNPEFRPAEVEALGLLRVGEVSQPSDSPEGFQILLRTESEPSAPLAMSYIYLPYDSDAAVDKAQARQRVVSEAQKIATEVSGDPTAFDRLRVEKCCQAPERWTQGRGRPGAKAVVERLAIGEIARAPLESDSAFLIVRRLDPATVPEPSPPSYDVPNPSAPDFDAVVRYTSEGTLAKSARALGTESVKALKLDAAGAAEVPRIMDRLAVAFETPDKDEEFRIEKWHGALDEMRKLLGSKDYSRFTDFLNTWATRQMVALPKW